VVYANDFGYLYWISRQINAGYVASADTPMSLTLRLEYAEIQTVNNSLLTKTYASFLLSHHYFSTNRQFQCDDLHLTPLENISQN
jgi:hypothetical protein